MSKKRVTAYKTIIPSKKKKNGILNGHNHGMKRNQIKNKYKATDSGLISIIPKEVKKEKENIIIAHPKLFKLRD